MSQIALARRAALAAVNLIAAVPYVRVSQSHSGDLITGVVTAAVIDGDYLEIRRKRTERLIDSH